MANEQPSITAAHDAAGKYAPEKEAGMVNKESNLADEIKAMQWEPLLPVEKKLIGWSIGLGVVLLGFLVWASYAFFPGGH